MQTLATEFNARINSERRRQENVNSYKQQILSMEDDLQQAHLKGKWKNIFQVYLHLIFKFLAQENEPILRDINNQLRDNFAPKEEIINRKIENARTEGSHITNELNGIILYKNFTSTLSEISLIYYITLEQQSKLRGIEDVDRNRLSQLSHQNKDVYDAILWLRENRNQFRANIYEPPAIAVMSIAVIFYSSFFFN